MPSPGKRLKIGVVGAGSLGRVLALSLHRAGYNVTEIVTRAGGASQRRAAQLARKVRARATSLASTGLDYRLLWLCVPDDSIRECASELARQPGWKGRIVLHTSGALGAEELDSLRRRGAYVASVHPMNTFIAHSRPTLKGIPFAAQGDAKAIAAVRPVIRALQGELFSLRRRAKVLYHATGSFSSPLLVALLSIAGQTARSAGISKPGRLIQAIVRQTVDNFFALGEKAAFSGPLRRGDVKTIARHLRALRQLPAAREAYIALARVAAARLPVKRRAEVEKMLRGR